MNKINKIFNDRVITTGKPTFPTKPLNGNSKELTRVGFEDILREKISESQEIKFSKHAELRLRSRNINIDPERKHKLMEAIERADKKGVKESLVLMDDIGFVVSIKNKTVITAVNKDELKENVFTNIDGAVII